jgi:hypothetical protein
MVTIADANDLDLTAGMTLAAWVNPSDTTAWRSVILKERSYGLAYALYAADSGLPGTFISTATGTDLGAKASTSLPLSTWSYIAATYEGTTIKFYVNGTLVSSHVVSGDILTSTGALRIGGNTVWGEWFSGLIDEVRVYNVALTATQIQIDMITPIG